MMKFRLIRFIVCIGVSCICFSCDENKGDKGLLNNGYLEYVDTRVGTAASIADITVTEVEEPMGYVSPIVGNPSALTHWTPQTAKWTDRVITVPVPYWYDQNKNLQTSFTQRTSFNWRMHFVSD